MEKLTQNKKPIQIELEVGKGGDYEFKDIKRLIQKLTELDVGENDLKIKLRWDYAYLRSND